MRSEMHDLQACSNGKTVLVKRLRTELDDQKDNFKKHVEQLKRVYQEYVDNKKGADKKIKITKKDFKENFDDELRKIRSHLNNNTEAVGSLFMSTA